jgi:hypothetical protein
VRETFGTGAVSQEVEDVSMQPGQRVNPSDFRGLLISARVTNTLHDTIEVHLSNRGFLGLVNAGASSPVFDVSDGEFVSVVIHDSGIEKQRWAADFFNGIYQEIVVRDPSYSSRAAESEFIECTEGDIH